MASSDDTGLAPVVAAAASSASATGKATATAKHMLHPETQQQRQSGKEWLDAGSESDELEVQIRHPSHPPRTDSAPGNIDTLMQPKGSAEMLSGKAPGTVPEHTCKAIVKH